MRAAIIRTAHFNAAHQLYVKEWSQEKNFELFGKCANPNFHGHNYEIEVRLSGEVDPVTGMIINLKELKDIIKEEIEDRFDHKNLNLDCPEFKDLMTSVENIVYVIWKILREKLDDKFDLRVRLYETPRNFAEYPAD
ncbi:MAG TPA: 6-carboxytetrahydropterin synthase [Saprospiraceae bacterium]|nr:6-carboxytetrahydropterin synthase [Saprospiraceae bacterium]